MDAGKSKPEIMAITLYGVLQGDGGRERGKRVREACGVWGSM